MTDLQTKDFGLSIKSLSDEGTFEGYGSIFGNVDSYGDKVMPGAFVKSLARHKAAGSSVLMLWNHDRDTPIGVWEELVEDQKGLFGRGRLLLDIPKARETHVLMKHNAIGGLSIGYKEIKVSPDGNYQKLEEADLYEISPVTFPANKRARITAVKGMVTRSEFIAALRETMGLSRAAAEAVAAKGYGALSTDIPTIDLDPITRRLAAATAELKAIRS